MGQVSAHSAHTSRVFALVGFKAPNALDSLKLDQVASSIAIISKSGGPEHGTSAASMERLPKGGSQAVPV